VLARLTAAVALPAAAEERPADPAPEVHTLLYMVPRMPVIIRLNVDIDGRTLDETWRPTSRTGFVSSTRDGDGVLRGEEAARIPAAGAEAVGIPSVRELQR